MKYSRLSVVQRYADGKRHIVNGLFKGVSIERGAVATFWPAPKPYFVVVGQQSAEMCHCLKQVDGHAGACIVTEGEAEKAAMPLDIYGVMANMTVKELTAAASAIDAALEDLGNRNTGEPVVNKLLSLFISLHRFRLMK
jgi:adenine deaminase